MIETFLAPFSFAGGNFGDLLMYLEQMSFFTLVLPFLLIFVIIFGVLSKIRVLGDNNAINAVIAVAVGLMALQFGFVTNFFAQIFPRLGMWLAVILVIIIVLGLVNKEAKWPVGLMILIAGVIAAIVIGTSFNEPFLDYGIPNWLADNAGWLLPVIVIGGVIAWAWGSTKPEKNVIPAIIQKLTSTA
ncbi:hypothetical protein HYT24_02200 [Candidatus Pacearchaeota archaeon]|nr:hypothetical protein [Candidatus Pacearchaeota archaeon]